MANILEVIRRASDAEAAAAVRSMSKSELEALLEETADWSTGLESKFDLYKSVPAAKPFHESPAKIRAVFGGNRSSKTTAAMVDTTAQLVNRWPRSIRPPSHRIRRGPVYARWSSVDKRNGIEKIAYDAVEKWTPPGSLVTLAKDLLVANYITGSKLEFMSYEQESTAYQGTARHILNHDEEPPKAIWDENLLRTLGVGGEMVLSMTPTEGMTWVYDDIWLNAGRRTFYLDGSIRTVELPEGDPNIHVFLYDTYDNPHLSQEDIHIVEGMIATEEDRRVRFHGEFLSFAGLVYKEFSDDVHIVDDFVIPKDWPVYVSLDPHPRTEHMYVMLAVDPKGDLFVFDEFFMHATIDQLAVAIKVKEKDRWVIRRTIDPWALIEDQLTHTALDQELRKRGVNFLPASKDRARGIMVVKDALAWERKGDVFTKRPRLFVFRGCKRLRWEIARYVWADYKRSSTDRTPKQTPKDKDDHAVECLYRLLLCEPRWFDKKDVDAERDDTWKWSP